MRDSLSYTELLQSKNRMKKNRLIIQLLVLVLATISIASCSDSTMDDINKNPNNPKDATAKFVVTDLETATAFSVVGGDFSLYASVYMEHETGTHNQLFNAETRSGEPSVSTTYNNAWGSVYTNIMYAKTIIAKCSEGGFEEGNSITLGVGKLFLAYNAAIIADLFGDAPYSEAGETNPDGTPKYMQPKVDKQEDIYKDVIANINEAIELFGKTDAGVTGGMGANDFIYSGNAAKWKKAAYALKARYTMRLLARSANQQADLQTILDCISNSFTSPAEEFKYGYDGGDSNNPLGGFYYSRLALGASQSLINKYLERNDPRVYQSFGTYYPLGGYINNVYDDPADIDAAPNGDPVQSQNEYSVSVACGSWAASTQLMSYHELMFLKAEAECRLNKLTDAEASLKKAITAGFSNLANTLDDAWGESDLGADVAEEYFTTTVKPLFDANPLQETMIQKYLSFAGASGEAVETYSDYRRMQALGENFIVLENQYNPAKFPQRYTYGSSDVTTNNAVKEAFGDGSYIYTDKVWWAGGTR